MDEHYLNINLVECPRCGGSHQLIFTMLQSQGYDSDFNMYATCPVTNQPIFLHVPLPNPMDGSGQIMVPLDMHSIRAMQNLGKPPVQSSHQAILQQIKLIIGSGKDTVEFIKTLQQVALNLATLIKNSLADGRLISHDTKIRDMSTYLLILLRDTSPSFDCNLPSEENFSLKTIPLNINTEDITDG